MSRDEEFIEYTDSIKWMLKNVIDMTNIILNDFERNGKVHPDYIEEKLGRAKYDLDNLYSMAIRKIADNHSSKED